MESQMEIIQHQLTQISACNLQETYNHNLTNNSDNIRRNSSSSSYNIGSYGNLTTSTPSSQVETGWFQCPSSSDKVHYLTTQFKHSYKYPPAVLVSVTRVVGRQPGDDVYFWVDVIDTSRTEFTVQCMAWYDSHISYLGVTWISVAQS